MSTKPAAEVFTRHEVKGQPAPIPRTKIVEAYGLQMCPKLVQQVAGDDLEVRVNALAVLSEEFRNPMSIEGCTAAGIIKVLSHMVVDPDYNTRLLSSKALAIAAVDANGLQAILYEDAVGDILRGVNDPSEEVRQYIYECICHASRTPQGIDACVKSNVSAAFVKRIATESPALYPIILQTVYNIVSFKEEGLVGALEAKAVTTCIKLLDSNSAATRSEAAKVLGFLCYDEGAKSEALENDAIEKLLSLLYFDEVDSTKTKEPLTVVSSVTLALMAVTSTDEGKRRVYSAMDEGAAATIIATLLYIDHRIIRMNTMKVISNIAVYPPIRELLLRDNYCVRNLQRMEESEDSLVRRHAKIALDACNWTP